MLCASITLSLLDPTILYTLLKPAAPFPRLPGAFLLVARKLIVFLGHFNSSSEFFFLLYMWPVGVGHAFSPPAAIPLHNGTSLTTCLDCLTARTHLLCFATKRFVSFASSALIYSVVVPITSALDLALSAA